MATAGNIKYNVTCGVNEDDGKTITLMYTIPDPVGRITWEWNHQQAKDGTSSHVAHMIAQDSNRGHKSQPIPDHVYKKLGTSPKKKRDNKYLKVIMTRKDGVSIEEYFNSTGK